MRYRLGWPMGKAMARIGVPTLIRVNVIRDEEAGVYVGTSFDLRGLVIEAGTFEELVREAEEMIPCLLDGNERDHHFNAELRYADQFARA